eukprot:scaffold8599_cov110-Isochrysis_galbana.AAC.7
MHREELDVSRTPLVRILDVRPDRVEQLGQLGRRSGRRHHKLHHYGERARPAEVGDGHLTERAVCHHHQVAVGRVEMGPHQEDVFNQARQQRRRVALERDGHAVADVVRPDDVAAAGGQQEGEERGEGVMQLRRAGGWAGGGGDDVRRDVRCGEGRGMLVAAAAGRWRGEGGGGRCRGSGAGLGRAARERRIASAAGRSVREEEAVQNIRGDPAGEHRSRQECRADRHEPRDDGHAPHRQQEDQKYEEQHDLQEDPHLRVQPVKCCHRRGDEPLLLIRLLDHLDKLVHGDGRAVPEDAARQPRARLPSAVAKRPQEQLVTVNGRLLAVDLRHPQLLLRHQHSEDLNRAASGL